MKQRQKQEGLKTLPTKKKTSSAPDESEKIDISGIKGSMTIQEASESLKIELKEFYKLFKIPDNVPAQTQMKGIVSVSPGYDFEKIKESLK